MRNRNRVAGVFLLSFLVLVLAGCGTGGVNSAGEENSMGFAKNGDGYADLSVEQLATLMREQEVTLVNVHVPYEGELPQTDLFIPYDEIQEHLAELPAKDAPIVLYCRSGSMSTTAAKVLTSQGYLEVMELDGGFNAWKAAGYELLTNR